MGRSVALGLYNPTPIGGNEVGSIFYRENYSSSPVTQVLGFRGHLVIHPIVPELIYE